MKLSKDDKRTLAWLDDHVKVFKACREAVDKVKAEEKANRKAMLKEKVAA